jgi:ferredoxin-type protein NapF
VNRARQDNRKQHDRKRRFRLAVRCCFLALATLLLLPILPWSWTSTAVPAVTPFVLLCSTVAARALSVSALIGLPVLAVALFRRRWFCRYMCPVGLISETVSRLSPCPGRSFGRIAGIGRWIALITLAGAALGYPLLLWLDPMAMFSGFFGLWHSPLSAAGWIASCGLLGVVVLNFFWPHLWCTRLCPSGATQELLADARPLFRSRKAPGQPPPEGNALPVARRSFLAMGAGAAWALLALNRSPAAESRPVRPPGAADEERFAGLCIRCGNCMRACPTGVIQPDLGRGGVAGFLAPVVRFDHDYCLENCHECTRVCPSGAISRLSLEEKMATPIGLAMVDPSICLRSGGQECHVCVNKCPYAALEMAPVDEANDADPSSPLLPRVDPERCPGCGCCEAACVTSPRKAITVEPRDDTRG